MMHIQHEVKIFLHMNLSYELIKHIKRNRMMSLPFRWPNKSMVRSISLLTTELAYSLSVLIRTMLLRRCFSIVLWRLSFKSV